MFDGAIQSCREKKLIPLKSEPSLVEKVDGVEEPPVPVTAS